MSKVFERLLVNTQHAFQKLVETCKKTSDNRGFVGVVVKDLSKAFYYLNYESFLAKLNAYGFSKSAMRMVYIYLTRRKQRVEMYASFSCCLIPWLENSYPKN